MTFGLTSTGFRIKRLADIKSEMESAFRGTFGAGINLDARRPLGQIIGIMSAREAAIWELAEAVYYSQYPGTSEGVNLDQVVALTGITRQGATYSTVSAIIQGTAGTIIPAGSVVSVDGNDLARFETDSAVEIQAAVDEVQTISFSNVPDAGTWTIGFGDETTSSLPYNATASSIQTALRALDGLTDVLVTGSFAAGFVITFTGADGGQAQPTVTIETNTLNLSAVNTVITITVNTEGKTAQVPVTLTAETAGSIQAPAGTLTEIETPISGWTSIANALDAEVGDDEETDAELRTRRAASIQIGGTGTADAIRADLLALDDVTACLVFENKNTTVDDDGRPGKSFEVLISGGDSDEIAATIFASKAAGVETFGSTSVTITDSQDYEHLIKFNRPTSVPIYLEVDVTTNVRFPIDGETLLKNQVIAYGATLSMGDNVIVTPALVSYLGEVNGITDLTIRIGKTASPVTDDNVEIEVRELAEFDTSRITINLV